VKRSSLKRRPKRISPEEKAARDHFRVTVLAEPCLFSQTRPEHRCEGVRDPHHVLREQSLRAHFSTMEDKWQRVHDPANGVALCRSAHDPVTTKATYIFREELPARVVDWAHDNGLDWLLEREAPSLFLWQESDSVDRSVRSDLTEGAKRV
jgi:hypothetical protein